MLISPLVAIDKGWIEFPSYMSEHQKQKCIQPNAIDFTLDHLHVVEDNTATITENKKEMRQTHPYELTDVNSNLLIESNVLYDVMSDFYVNVPDNVACKLIIRSTFSRSGILMNNGLYDSGFKGNIGCTLFNMSKGLLITESCTRIGQIMFIESASVGQYSGGYNRKKGEHWTDKGL